MATGRLRTVEEQAQSLANYFPGGPLFGAANINNSTFRKLLRGLAVELVTTDGKLRSFEQEIIPDQTVLFIDEWESALGIPDSCFPGTGALDDRRLHVLIKLASLGVQTKQDFISLASLFGITVTIVSESLANNFPRVFPWVFFGGAKAARYTLVVSFAIDSASRFPLSFSILFGSEEIGILECLFRKLIPANCDIIFKQI